MAGMALLALLDSDMFPISSFARRVEAQSCRDLRAGSIDCKLRHGWHQTKAAMKTTKLQVP